MYTQNPPFPYKDILHLPHHVSHRRRSMSLSDRAAQFAPFAALTDYESAIQEAARITCDKLDLGEEHFAALNRKFQEILDNTDEEKVYTFTYYQPDARKKGGSYQQISDRVKRVDPVQRIIFLHSGKKIAMDELVDG